MLSIFQVKNFKSFSDTGEINVTPLMFLSGINSSGKSSVFQPLLLLKQTINSQRELNLQGDLMPSKISFRDLVFNKPSLDDAQLDYAQLDYALQFCYGNEDGDDKSGLLFDLIHQFAGCSGIQLGSHHQSIHLAIDLQFRHGNRGLVRHSTEQVTKLVLGLRYGDTHLVDIEIATVQGEKGYKVKIVEDGSPNQVFKEIELAIDGITNFLPSSFIFEGNVDNRHLLFGKMFRILMSLVRNDLSKNISYLGSNRAVAQRAYPYDQSGFVVKKDGGNFPSVFWNLREEEFDYFLDGKIVTASLESLLHSILHQIGLDQKVSIRKIQHGVELIIVELDTLNGSDSKVMLPDVGQGYNQILPMIIQGLIAPKNGLVIFEQPETYLHPKVQSQLIEFFVGLARSGRNVFIETHSSHLLDNLQLQVVKDYSNWVQDNSRVLFVWPPHNYNPSARTEAIKIGRYGSIENSPNFLPDTSSLYDEIIRAGFEKQRIEKSGQ